MAFPTITKVSLVGSLRRPPLYMALAVFGVLVFLSHFFTLFTLGETSSMVEEVGISSILLCGVLVSIFLNAESLASETESGTLAVLLTKPTSRTSVLLAKFSGNLLAVFLTLAALTLVFAITLALDGRHFDTLTVQAIALSFTASSMAASITLVLATFLPFSAVVLASLCLFALGSLSGYFLSLVSGFPALPLTILYAVLPDYDILNLTNRISAGTPLPAAAFAWSLAYGAIYTALALTAACLIFSRREIK